MFKKLLKAVLPALLVFSFTNVNDAKVEAANKKINVRVDYLEEGTNKKLAESAKLSGDENVFATISLPQNLANEYDTTQVHKQLVASDSVSHSPTTNHTVVTNHKPTVVTTHRPAQRPTAVVHRPVAQKPAVQRPTAQRPTAVAQKPAAHRPVAQQNHKPVRKTAPQAKRRGG